MTPGAYAIPAADYHRDPAPAPSLSASVAHLLVSRSAMHAWHAHPRLNPEWEPDEPSSEQEEGTALHALLLEREDRVMAVKAKDWRGKTAQNIRSEARKHGLVAILQHRWDDLRRCAVEMRRALMFHEVGDFLHRPGTPEQSLFWQEDTQAGPIWCRSRIDWMADDVPVIFDLKTLGGSAEPDAWGRKALRDGAAIQVVQNLRGARALGLPHRKFLFVLLERDAPHAVSVVELAPSLLAMAEEQLAYAREMWGACLRDGEWPSYPPMVATIEASSGALYGHQDWQQRVEAVRSRKPKPFAGAGDPRVVNSEQPFA